jgi:hypothetical protein
MRRNYKPKLFYGIKPNMMRQIMSQHEQKTLTSKPRANYVSSIVFLYSRQTVKYSQDRARLAVLQDR